MIIDYDFSNDITNVKDMMFRYFEELGDSIAESGVLSYLNNIEFYMKKYPSLVFRLFIEDNRPIGFIFGNVDYIYNEVKCGLILELYVDSNYRNRCIGRHLISSFETSCINVDHIYLTTTPSATVFYEKLGFKTNNELDANNNQIIFFKKINKLYNK